jgi:hypothetical protein
MVLSVPLSRLVDARVLSECFPVKVTREKTCWGVVRCTPQPRTSPPSVWVRNDVAHDDITDPHQRYVFAHIFVLFLVFNADVDFSSPLKSKLTKDSDKIIFEYSLAVGESICLPHIPSLHGLSVVFTLSGAQPVLRISVDLTGPPNVRKTIFAL